VEDPVTLEFVDGLVDDDGFPVLAFSMDDGYIVRSPSSVYGIANMSNRETTLSDVEKGRF
jgi:hypothetical protein